MKLIDGEELLARYKARCNGCKETKNYCEHCCDIADIINDIEDAPTIEERKKGKWRHYDGMYACEICRSQLDDISPFCPMCGADMREEKADGKIC